MFEKLLDVERRYEELLHQMMDPEVASDVKRYAPIAREHTSLTPLVTTFRRYKTVLKGITDAEEMVGDSEMKELAQMELDELKPQVAPLEKELKLMLLPKDPADDKNVIMEFRPGTGGGEAELFCAQILRMYMRWAERLGWKSELIACQGPTGWEILARAVWPDSPDVAALRHRWDVALGRLRARLREEGVRALLRADGAGQLALELYDGDEVDDRT